MKYEDLLDLIKTREGYTIEFKESVNTSLGKNLNLLTNDRINNVGILFFAKRIKKYFQTASIMCFLYSDTEQTEIIDSKEFADDFITNLENTNNYLISKLNTAIIIKEELKHKERLELPKEALREAIINAMIHRDYFVNSNVQINISPPDANPTQIRRKWILTTLEKNKKITNKTIRENFKIHKDTVAEDIRKLIRQNKIVKKGAGNNVWYELNEETKK